LKDAYHAYDPEFWTPMANGVVSFKNKQRAENYISEQGFGELYDEQALKKHDWSWEE
jgi:copper chaperone NosL